MGIYQAGPTAIRQLSVAQGALSDSIKFDAVTAIIDNFTDQYLHLPDVGRYVPPWTFSVIIPMNATNMLNALFQAPPGVVQAPSADTTQAATITYLAVELPASSGASGSPLIVPVRQGTWNWTALAGDYATLVISAQGAASVLLEGVLSSGYYEPLSVYGGPSANGPWTLLGVLSQIMISGQSLPTLKSLGLLYPYLLLNVDNSGSANPATGTVLYQLSTDPPVTLPKRGLPLTVDTSLTNMAAGASNEFYNAAAAGRLIEIVALLKPAAANWVLSIWFGSENGLISRGWRFSDLPDPPVSSFTGVRHYGANDELVWMGGGYWLWRLKVDERFDLNMVLQVINDSAATVFSELKVSAVYELEY